MKNKEKNLYFLGIYFKLLGYFFRGARIRGIDTGKVETRRRSSDSPNCIYGLDHGRRRNDIKAPVALRRSRCIICWRVVKRFQLVFPCRSSSSPTRAREPTAIQLNRAVQFFLIIRKSSLIHPGYLPTRSPSLFTFTTTSFDRG